MAHPVRGRLLIAVTEKGEPGASISQLAERTGESKRKVRYHLEAMLESGLVAIASEQRRGGVVERFFRAEQHPWLTEDAFHALGEDARRQIAVELLKVVFSDVTAAVRAKSLGERPVSLVRLPMEVDEQGWRELLAVHQEMLIRLHDLRGEVNERLKASGEIPIAAMNALLLFTVPPWPAQ
jgi:DNA-binding transcriptional ArsR family regulator